MATPTRHCHNCGWEYTIAGLPGRTESCHQCGADLKVCLNCVSYDRKVAYQCRDRRADEVAEKHMANFCEYFDFVRREWKGKAEDKREASARDQLSKLLGD
jgi:ribosome-binding protein aMBF1 (putative translation factor)